MIDDDNADTHAQVAELEKEKSSHTGEENVSWGEVLKWKTAVTVGCGLMFIQAMTGINSVIFYSTTIFGFAGFSESILATASVGAVNVLSTILSAYLVDKLGRKTLLMGGELCCAIFDRALQSLQVNLI